MNTTGSTRGRETINDSALERLAEGEEAALAGLFRAKRERVYRYAVRLLGDTEAAEDVVQDTFLKARLSAGTIREARSVEAWLFAIARNRVTDLMRQKRPLAGLDPEDLPGDCDPLADLIHSDLSAILRKGMAALKAEYREVLVLREYEQLSYGEIAAIAGVSEEVVAMRLLRARRALMRLLQPFREKEGGNELQ